MIRTWERRRQKRQSRRTTRKSRKTTRKSRREISPRSRTTKTGRKKRRKQKRQSRRRTRKGRKTTRKSRREISPRRRMTRTGRKKKQKGQSRRTTSETFFIFILFLGVGGSVRRNGGCKSSSTCLAFEQVRPAGRCKRL